MTVPTEKTIDNYLDTRRKIPAAALVPSMLTDAEGISVEKITGPAASATVELSQPATAVVAILGYVTATGMWHATLNPIPLEGTNYSITLENANGVCALTEINADDRSTETWIVFYNRKSIDPTQSQGGTVTP